MTKGEQKIYQILYKSKIIFIQQKTFLDLRGGRFRYDFYCPNINGQQVIIQFNGEQHYHQVHYFHKSISDFKTGQQHDRRKITYALANNIKIYQIPYWELNNLKSIQDVLQLKFLAHDRWHNDDVWRNYIKNIY